MGHPSAASARASLTRPQGVLLVVIAALAAALIAVVAIVIVKGAAPAKLSSDAIDWPSSGAAALSFEGDQAVSPGADIPRPMASVTKLVTALVVLDRAPLPPGSPGPDFPITDLDLTFVQQAAAVGGIVTQVTPGDVLNERQLLEDMLVTSSNNLATTLVTRIFGSEQEYLIAARAWLDSHDLENVHVADASGLSPENQASARDLLTIGALAAANETITSLAAEPLTLDADGQPHPNTNDLLAIPGVTGLKTGHITEAGYTAVFTADLGGSTPLVGVLLGSPSQAQRSTDVTRLIAAARASLRE